VTRPLRHRALLLVSSAALALALAATLALVMKVAAAHGDVAAAGKNGRTAYVRPGGLVPGFGDGGIVRTDPAAGETNAGEVLAIDPAGRLLLLTSDVAGTSRLTRLLDNGAPDSSFGEAGVVALPAGVWEDVAVDPAGRIVLSGSVEGDLAVARLTADGDPDSTFGDGGVGRLHVSVPPNSPGASIEESLSHLVLLPDGGIVAAGVVYACEECVAHAEVAARFGPDGAPDPGFGAGGAYVTDFGVRTHHTEGESPNLAAVAVQPDGEVLLGGTDGWNLTVLRLTAQGAPDASFGKGGFFASDHESGGEEGVFEIGTARALLLEGDGRIVVVGDRYLYGLRPDGTLDPDFGHKGFAPVAPRALGAESDQTTDALLDAAGRIVVVGAGGASSTVDRLLPDGRADARFSGGGLASVSLSDAQAPEKEFQGYELPEALESVVQLPGGDLVATGYAYRHYKHPYRQVTLVRRNDIAGHLAHCDGKPVVFQGTPGPDRIPYVNGPVATFGGDDVIRSGLGSACTGPGDDVVRGRIFGTIALGPGDDRAAVAGRVLGGTGDDEIRLGRGLTAPIDAVGGPGEDLLVGGEHPDRLRGGPGDDRLFGNGGRDLLSGGAGNDLLVGGPATDRLLGGSGKNRLFPGADSPPSATYAGKARNLRIRIPIENGRFVDLETSATFGSQWGSGAVPPTSAV
jgi:uncharacterized delta-60 repeat protein